MHIYFHFSFQDTFANQETFVLHCQVVFFLFRFDTFVLSPNCQHRLKVLMNLKLKGGEAARSNHQHFYKLEGKGTVNVEQINHFHFRYCEGMTLNVICC